MLAAALLFATSGCAAPRLVAAPADVVVTVLPRGATPAPNMRSAEAVERLLSPGRSRLLRERVAAELDLEPGEVYVGAARQDATGTRFLPSLAEPYTVALTFAVREAEGGAPLDASGAEPRVVPATVVAEVHTLFSKDRKLAALIDLGRTALRDEVEGVLLARGALFRTR